jgi:hypothetical protein
MFFEEGAPVKRKVVLSLVVAFVSALAPAPGLRAQAKAIGDTGVHRIEGTVMGINKAKSTFMLRQKNRNNVVLTIAYTDHTRYTYLNEPATLADVKATRGVICLGKLNEKGTVLTASEIDVRTPRKY